MAHTPLFEKLIHSFRVAGESVTTGKPIAAILEQQSRDRMSRREFLEAGTLAGVALTGVPDAMRRFRVITTPRVAIVVAGLAGLTCAYRLKQAGVVATIYEGNTRLGGRCWSLRGAFNEGQIAEHGGELIDQSHTEIRQLAQQLGLNLDNLLAAEQNGTEPFYYFDGARQTFAETTDAVKQIWQAMHADLSAASYPTLFDNFTAAGFNLDHMSILDWINSRVPGGHASPLGQLLDVAYNIEYGAKIGDQSSLNLLYLLGYSGPGQFRIFGPSNEKYHVRGGNDQIVSRLAQAVDGQIETDAALSAIVRNSDGRYTLTFGSGRTRRSVTADQVVLALPFSKLREVDYSKAGFVEPKTFAIEEMPIGANAKVHLQFTNRHWRTLGNNGDSYAETGYQDTWEVSRGQGGTSGLLVNYTGGDTTRSQSGLSADQAARRFLGQVEPVLPGLGTKWNGKATMDYWPSNPWTHGAYSYWRVGQYTRFAGSEYLRSNNCHFCGEHTSIDSQGYLNGAVETGQRAAADVLADLKVKGYEK
ncbi:MAG: monoamine oxidase [Gemmatimonadales bacterium]|nr:monoamine oxidase [Gemmatimonadales bacterium]